MYGRPHLATVLKIAPFSVKNKVVIVVVSELCEWLFTAERMMYGINLSKLCSACLELVLYYVLLQVNWTFDYALVDCFNWIGWK